MMQSFEYSMWILILPVVTFLLLGLFGKNLKPKISGLIGTLSMAVTTVLGYVTAFQYFFSAGKAADGSFKVIQAFNYEWLRFSDFLHIDLGFYLDSISAMMLIVITTVSLMVHIYSLGYMKGEKGFERYYAFLSLFSFSMLGLVVATNIFQMYIFWELVGVSSYLLIGFYYEKPSAVSASKKAFIVTRFADFFFLIGILLMSYFTKTFDFATLTQPGAPCFASFAGVSFLGISAVSWATFLIFLGGAGKSAMLPFHIWLPDAMEGPTPVSALIHAATMVVAGVFLIARLFPVYFFQTPEVLHIIGYIGGITALFAAVVACTQTDIKRVLAFSTISQIAYMVTALSVSGFEGHEGLGYMASMFHLFTHAFFKALLFLGAGAIIHAVHSNEMDDMGGLWKKMPIANITFLIACLAISGIPPFSGFFSKDEIISAAFEHDKILFALLYGAAGLTAFYMFRLYYRIFHYENKVYHHEPHDAGFTMSFPLIFLAIVTLVVGWLIPFNDFVTADGKGFETHIDWSVAALSILIALIGIAAASVLYFKKSDKADRAASAMGWLYTAIHNKFYFDEIWYFITKKIVFKCVSAPMAWIDVHLIDGFLNNLANFFHQSSDAIKGMQSGRIQQYALIYLIGVVLLVITFSGMLVAFITK